MKLRFRFFIFLILFYGAFSDVLAQTKSSSTSSSKTKMRRQEITFEDELIQGGTQKPELFYLLQKRNFNYGKLIKMRDNFIPEMEQAAQGLQRIRRKN